MELEEVYDKILPPQFDNTFKRATGYAIPDIINYDVPPSNPSNEYDNKYNRIHFTINSSNLLDPYSLILNLTVEHKNNWPIQLDHSAHSLISEISVFSNGQEIERIKDYDFLMSLFNDMEVTRSQRYQRRADEGFGTNEYGTDEIILYPESKEKNFYYNESIHIDNNRIIEYDQQYSLTAYGVEKFMYNVPDFRKTVDNNHISKFPLNAKKNKDPLETPLYNCNDWNYVIDGKLSPYSYKLIDAGNRNKYTFKIPLNLRTIGFGINPNNYKLIPLELFGALTIVVTLNPYAFFVPFPISEAVYFGIDSNYAEYLKEKLEKEVTAKYYVSKATLSTKQLRFNPSIHTRIIDKIKAGDWITDYIDLELCSSNYYLPHKTGPSVTYTKSVEKNNIKAFYIVFTNDLYKYTPYARKLTRYNKGIKSISFKQAGLEFPKPTMEERNSLTSHGEQNGSYFYEQFMNCIARMYDTNGLVINRSTYHIDIDMSHIIALLNLKFMSHNIARNIISTLDTEITLNKYFPIFDQEWLNHYKEHNAWALIHNELVPPLCSHLKLPVSTNYSGLIKPIQPKTIYAINFEPTPGSGVAYKTSISTSFNIPFVIEMERVASYHNNDIWNNINNVYFIQNIFYETYVTLQMSPYGNFVKI